MDIVRKVEFKKVDFLNSIFLKFKKIESMIFKFHFFHRYKKVENRTFWNFVLSTFLKFQKIESMILNFKFFHRCKKVENWTLRNFVFSTFLKYDFLCQRHKFFLACFEVLTLMGQI